MAIGDSQTEGVGDPTGRGGLERGWADRMAEDLAARQGHLLYANLAIRGRGIAEVEQEQLEPALAMKPDLASLVAGLNDVIRPGSDVDSVLDRMDGMQAQLIAAGATVLSITYPDPVGIMPVGRYMAEKFAAFNQGLREVAARNGVRLLDIEPVEAATDLRLWCPDRLHLNPLGHERLAAGMGSLLEPGTDRVEWPVDLPPAPQPSRPARIAGEARWAAVFLTPWIWRRLTGRSSGDGRVARRPMLLPVEPD